MMIEPANLNAENIVRVPCDGYVPMAKALLNRTADVGFFLQDAFTSLSAAVRQQLRPLVTSQISVIQHVLLVGPKLQPRYDALCNALSVMHEDSKGREVLDSLGFARWELMEQEDVEFMIDLMDTLQS
jgi:phosphonate transport system substrate-binding protein